MSEDEERLKGESLIARPGGEQMAQKITRQGRGPRRLNAEGQRMSRVACAPLIQALKSQPSERCVLDSGPPPPLCLKVERRGGGGGVWNLLACRRSRRSDHDRRRGAPSIPDPPPPSA
jgi:hypothetical protein